MGKRQLLRNVITLYEVKQQPSESITIFYGRFHENISDIDRRVIGGNIV